MMGVYFLRSHHGDAPVLTAEQEYNQNIKLHNDNTRITQDMVKYIWNES